MSSACSNPMLYGWLNDNFRKEFNEILCRRRMAHLSGAKTTKLKASSTVTSVTHKQVGLLKPLNTTDYQSELTVLVRQFTLNKCFLFLMYFFLLVILFNNFFILNVVLIEFAEKVAHGKLLERSLSLSLSLMMLSII